MKTCGQMYHETVAALEKCEGDRMSIGFLLGQAEKVSMGACGACMTKDVSIEDAARVIATFYNLRLRVLYPSSSQVRSPELWLYRERLPWDEEDFEIDSPEWNLHRAAICGVPASEINLRYHHGKAIRLPDAKGDA